MKASPKALATSFLFIFVVSVTSYSQNNEKDRGKAFYTTEEVRQMCGIPVDSAKMKKVLARQDSMYKEYIQEMRTLKSKVFKVETIPNWQGMMSDVENQGSCGDCWVHAATGVTEGQSSILYGSRLNADLDESEISGHCNGGLPTQAENFIRTNKMRSEVGSYPNLQSVRWGIVSYATVSGITTIKNVLANGPVTAGFGVYADFAPFFANNPTGVYRYDGHSSYLNVGHAVVIVSYDDNGSYWLCKNSWGSGWGDNGYFRIGYGQCGIESMENTVVTVNQSCYAKIVPNLFGTINTAFAYPFINEEWAYVTAGATLYGNISVPSEGTLVLLPGANVSFNGYYIEANRSRFIIQNGSTVYLTNGGSRFYGLYTSVQTACNHAGSWSTVEVQNGFFNEWPEINGKDHIIVSGQGENTLVNGFNIINSSVPTVNSLRTKTIYVRDCYRPVLNGVTIEPWSTDADYSFFMYNSSDALIEYLTLNNTPEGTGAVFHNCTGQVWGSDMNYSTFENNSLATAFSLQTVFYLSNPYFCSNSFDIGTDASSWVQVVNGTFSGNPASTTYGNVILWNSVWNQCSAPKSKSGTPKSTHATLKDNEIVPASNEFRAIDSAYSRVNENINKDILSKGGIDRNRYRNEFEGVLGSCKSFIKRNSSSPLAKAALHMMMNCCKQIDQVEEMQLYLDEILNNRNLTSIYGYAKRMLMEYYRYRKDFTKALSTGDEIVKENAHDEDLICDVRIAEGLLYAYYLNDNDDAIKSLSAIIDNYPGNQLSKAAKNELSLLGYGSEGNSSSQITIEGKDIQISNYPNPFNPSTTIHYNLPNSGKVELKVYDVLGREVMTLVNNYQEAGVHTAYFNGQNLASGVYFYHLTAPGINQIKKMLMVK